MKFLWISGWAVPPAWLAEQARTAFPLDTHLAVSATEAAGGLTRENPDALGGYSLGALWLLMQAKDLPKNIPVILLAPIFSFAAENGDGGRVALAQLRLQRRRFRNDAKATVTDFYRRSGLEQIVPAARDFSTEEIAALDQELGWLEIWQATAPPPQAWLGFVGENDALLDAKKLQEKWPSLRIVAQASHAPGPLFRAAAEHWQAKVIR
jgi:hypothetical protein